MAGDSDESGVVVNRMFPIVDALAIGTILIVGSLFFTVIIYWGPIEDHPVLSILWPWAMGAATIHWGLPLAKSLVIGADTDV